MAQQSNQPNQPSQPAPPSGNKRLYGQNAAVALKYNPDMN